MTFKVLVAVKRVPDSNVAVRVRADGSGLQLDGIRMSVNPFDEIAVEEAVRLRERGVATEIVAVTCGGSDCADALRTAMALGADRAIHVVTDSELQPLGVARLLHAIVQKEVPSLVLLGKQAIDDDASQTGPMLAALARLPQATNASALQRRGESLEVTREIDGGQEIVHLQLPAVVTADLRLNEPRYVTLPNMMKAKKKPIEIVAAQALGVDASPRIKRLKVSEPAKRSAGVRVGTVEELAAKLRDEAKVV